MRVQLGLIFKKVLVVLTPFQGRALRSTKPQLPAASSPAFPGHQPLGYLTTARKQHHTQVIYRLSYLHFTSTKHVI